MYLGPCMVGPWILFCRLSFFHLSMIFKSPKLKNWSDTIFCPRGIKLPTFPTFQLFCCSITPNLLTKSTQNNHTFANWPLLVINDLKSTLKNTPSKIPTYPPFANIEPNPFGPNPKTATMKLGWQLCIFQQPCLDLILLTNQEPSSILVWYM